MSKILLKEYRVKKRKRSNRRRNVVVVALPTMFAKNLELSKGAILIFEYDPEEKVLTIRKKEKK